MLYNYQQHLQCNKRQWIICSVIIIIMMIILITTYIYKAPFITGTHNALQLSATFTIRKFTSVTDTLSHADITYLSHTHTHTHTHTRTHARTHARTNARTHARTCAHTHTHTTTPTTTTTTSTFVLSLRLLPLHVSFFFVDFVPPFFFFPPPPLRQIPGSFLVLQTEYARNSTTVVVANFSQDRDWVEFKIAFDLRKQHRRGQRLDFECVAMGLNSQDWPSPNQVFHFQYKPSGKRISQEPCYPSVLFKLLNLLLFKCRFVVR